MSILLRRMFRINRISTIIFGDHLAFFRISKWTSWRKINNNPFKNTDFNFENSSYIIPFMSKAEPMLNRINFFSWPSRLQNDYCACPTTIKKYCIYPFFVNSTRQTNCTYIWPIQIPQRRFLPVTLTFANKYYYNYSNLRRFCIGLLAVVFNSKLKKKTF